MASADYVKCEVCGAKAVYDGDWTIRDQENAFAALCLSCSETHTIRAFEKANALLIACAPELLDALKGALGYMVVMDGDWDIASECISKAHTAISKAEGRS